MLDAQIQKIQIQNTQIQHMTKYQKDPTCAIFLKIGLFKDIKNDISMCQTCKYKIQIQNTQIKHIPKCQKDPACGIFLKRGLFKDIANDILMCQTCKYKKYKYKIHKYTVMIQQQ